MPCTTYNAGLFVRQVSEVFLIDRPADGSYRLTNRKATPQAMEALIIALMNLTDDAQVEISKMPISWNAQVIRMRKELDDWYVRLAEYRDLISEAIEADGDAQSIWYCVTAPLLLGWYPNETCDGIDPSQRTQQKPDVSTPLELLNQVCVYSTHNETLSAGALVVDFFETVTENLELLGEEMKELYEKSADTVAAVVEAVEETAKAVKKSPGAALAAATAIIAGVYILLKK